MRDAWLRWGNRGKWISILFRCWGGGGGEDACGGPGMGYEIRMNNKDAEGRSKMGVFLKNRMISLFQEKLLRENVCV